MRRVWVAALCAAGSLALAEPARAITYYDVSLTGTITSQGPGPDDANLHVGDTLTLTARVTDQFLARDACGPGCDYLGAIANVGLGLPVDPGTSWLITGGGLTWGPRDDEGDGHYPWFEYVNPDEHGDQSVDRSLAGPGLVIQDGQIVGFDEQVLLSPFYPTAPTMVLPDIGTKGGGFSLKNFGYYLNDRYTPGFVGTWDYAGSRFTVEPVPEPATWALMLAGFFGLGAALRRRRAAVA